jgi:UDP-N-acetylmuramoylalanine--D-glutamate ligase
MKHLAGRSVLILGLGASGLAMARWCIRSGARVQIWDSREDPPMREALIQACPGVTLRSGVLDPQGLLDLHLILKSPGLSPADERIAPLLTAARADRVAVAGELALFARALADLKEDRHYAPQVLAITGTNGKTTTTRLTGLLVERCGRRVAVAGNIGPTLLDTLAASLEAADAGEASPLPDVWVLELSSFQLDGVEGFEPTAATVLNITQDHLDWHGDMAHYGEAKSRVFGPAPRTSDDGTVVLSSTVMVINRDDERVSALEPAPIPVKGSRGRPGKPLVRRSIRFGLDAPTRPGDFGLVVEGGMAWLVRAHPQDEDEARPGRGWDEDLHIQRLMPVDALRIRGRHNAANALAALALATAIGCPLATMLHGLREYAGEPHRVSFVLRAGDIDVYDDSKGTNVGATVAAIRGLGQDLESSRLVLLLGGDGKGQDFGPLREPVACHARAVALYGRDARAIAAALNGLVLPMEIHGSLNQAAAWAFGQAQPGDAVVLSPACASLDQFRDYKHRAEAFVALAQDWAQDQGVCA